MTSTTSPRPRRAADRRRACEHCGLPVPRGAANERFCCSGCEHVHQLLHDSDLERFYDLGGGRGRPVASTQPAHQRDWIDAHESNFQDVAGVLRLDADVQGIHCAACVWLLQELWQRRSGAIDIRVNPALGRLRLVYDASKLDIGEYLDACESLGYRIGPPGKGDAGAERQLLVRLGACVVFALNAMVFALAEYLGMQRSDGPAFMLFRWLSLGLATLAFAVGGPVFFRAALAGLRRRVLHLDLPIALGIALGYGASMFAFVTDLGATYFDTVTVFIALMLAGRFVQQRALRRNRDFLLQNDGTEHVCVRRLGEEHGEIERVSVAEVLPDERLLLVPGDLVPVHAVLQDDAASFSLDWINGESEPRRFERGAEVPAGAFVAGRSGVVVSARATAAESGLQRLLALPREADRDVGARPFWAWLNRVYVAGVVGLAAIAALVWWVIDPSRVVDVVTSVLIVTCPCALGIATPLAFDLVLARLRRQGVFVRRGSLFDRARDVQRIVFDKTGTLTWGGVVADELRPVPGELTDVFYTMANSSNHPVSRAIAESLSARRPKFLRGLRVEDSPGRGLAATFQGREFRLGSRAFTLGDADRAEDGICALTRDGHVVGCYSVSEDFRAGAESELRELEGRGCELFLASGDRQAKVAQASARLGFAPERAFAQMTPESKAELVEELGANRTMMIGDGLNDALALDTALCAGTPALDRPVMPGRADFFYVGAGVGAVTAVLDGASRLHRVVRANLGLAAIYNIGVLGLCFAGVMTPWLVAVLMPLSSLVLIANTMHGVAAHRAGEEHA